MMRKENSPVYSYSVMVRWYIEKQGKLQSVKTGVKTSMCNKGLWSAVIYSKALDSTELTFTSR